MTIPFNRFPILDNNCARLSMTLGKIKLTINIKTTSANMIVNVIAIPLAPRLIIPLSLECFFIFCSINIIGIFKIYAKTIAIINGCSKSNRKRKTFSTITR